MTRQHRVSPCFTVAGDPKQRMTKESAEAAARGLNSKPDKSSMRRKPVIAYECPLCGSWHTGHQKSWRWRRNWTSWPKRRQRRRDEIGDGWE